MWRVTARKGSVLCVSNYPTRCNNISFFISANCFYMFRWYLHPSSGDHITVSTVTSSFSFFSSTTLREFWLAQLFLSISSSPASFVSNYSLPSSSSHSSHRLPILLLAFPSVLMHTFSMNTVMLLSTRGQPCQVTNCECSTVVVYKRPALSGHKL